MNESVVVFGDPTIDWAIKASSPETHPEERLTSGSDASLCAHQGGALLLCALIEEAIGADNVSGIGRLDTVPMPMEPGLDHTFSEIGYYDTIPDYPKWCTSAESSQGSQLLRDRLYQNSDAPQIATAKQLRFKRFLGFREAGKGHDSCYACDAEHETASIVVVDEAGLSFGKDGHDRLLERLQGRSGNEDRPWIVYKLSANAMAKSTLWNRIINDEKIRERLTVVVSAGALRKVGAEISSGSSWERSTQDLLAELERNPELSGLRACKRVIAVFGPTGALLIDRTGDRDRHTLFCHRQLVEDSWGWRYERKYGMMFGYVQVVTAQVTRALFNGLHGTVSDEELSSFIESALAQALPAIWTAYGMGFSENGNQIRFPVECMGVKPHPDDLQTKEIFGQCNVVAPELKGSYSSMKDWSILEDAIAKENLDRFEEVVREGLAKLENVPYAQFRHLVTVDRKEIEGLRSLRRLISSYLDDKKAVKPRSVAIFGAPGDGKSFAVREVAAELLNGKGGKRGDEPLEFNLSQFNSVTDLADALHQVRDRGLSRKLPPLVFFDEFDTAFGGAGLGWLRHFIAPMQEGSFLEGQVAHPIGRAILVFAGGTCKTFSELKDKSRESSHANAKGPDFIGRLSGYLDVASLNSQSDSAVECDALIRRALLLHSFLKDSPLRDPRDVSSDVLRAFLLVSKYNYGARSMRAIVDTSDLHANGKFTRSCLPPANQLNLHVDASEFRRIARNIP